MTYLKSNYIAIAWRMHTVLDLVLLIAVTKAHRHKAGPHNKTPHRSPLKQTPLEAHGVCINNIPVCLPERLWHDPPGPLTGRLTGRPAERPRLSTASVHCSDYQSASIACSIGRHNQNEVCMITWRSNSTVDESNLQHDRVLPAQHLTQDCQLGGIPPWMGNRSHNSGHARK